MSSYPDGGCRNHIGVAHSYCLYYSTRKPLSPGCGDVNVMNLFSQTFIIYMPLQHRPVAPGWRVSRTSVAMCTCTTVDHEFLDLCWVLCQPMSSDALVHLWISTEYLNYRKSCRTVGWMPCRAKRKSAVKVSMQRQCKGLKCIINI